MGELEIRDSAEINAGTSGNGDGGDLMVNAQTILIKGDQTGNLTGISSQSNTVNSGNAGDLTIHTDSLGIRNNAKISASTFGTGQAGNLKINANNILLHNAQIQSASFLENFDILENPSTAMSGNVQITVDSRLQLENRGSISVTTKKANAGMIKIGGRGTLKLSDNSEITTSVADGKGLGGDIFINTPLNVLDSSSIKAQADEGAGGNITISNFLFKSPHSIVSASSKLSLDGDLKLKPDTNISGSITELPDTLMDASSKISDRCSARHEGNLSSFVVKASTALPAKPGNLASSNIIDYSTVKNIAFNKFDSSEKPFTHLENNVQLPRMAKGCVE